MKDDRPNKPNRPAGDDYLWDGSGQPDPEVERLERLLVQFRSARPLPEVPEGIEAQVESVARRSGWRTIFGGALWPRWAAVAAVLLVMAAAWMMLRRLRTRVTSPAVPETASVKSPPKTGSIPAESSGLRPRNAFEAVGTTWDVARLQGAPQIGSSRIQSTGRLEVGQVLVTDDSSQASISVGEVGQVEVE
ncbi:MAG TPA: hypothetical protein VKU44_02700, partial [Terriglobia bacterium]|nr:hypothetical protein [Terriglobia bacterium]